MNEKKLVSVIMPTYNRGDVIGRAVKSVLGQSYTNIELIIIDDGSEDNTKDVINGFHAPGIEYIRLNHNGGACHARNVGISHAKGEYIAFLDSDNAWNKDYINSRIERIEEGEEGVGGYFGGFVLVRDQNTKYMPNLAARKRMIEYTSNEQFVTEMLYSNVIDTNTIVLKKEAIEGLNGFNESLKRLQDWEFFFRVLLYSRYQIRFADDRLVTNYVQRDSISKDNPAYWQSVEYFYRTYKDEFKKRNILEQCFSRQLLANVPVKDSLIESFLDVLDDAEKKETLMHIRRSYSSINSGAVKNALLIKWLSIRQKNVNLAEYLSKKGIHSIIIYGYGELGLMLKNELEQTECKVVGIIDRKISLPMIDGIKVYPPVIEERIADAVIVTAVSDYMDIRNNERAIEFISLSELINSVTLD